VKPVVLVVEDESDLVATYERLLRRQGCDVASAGSRADGLEALRAGRPGLVIADLTLPDGDGLDVVRAARALPSPAPVIVVTGVHSAATREAALAAGAFAVLSKPFSTRAFSDLVRSILGPARP
jgi:two-component system response regulator PrrA